VRSAGTDLHVNGLQQGATLVGPIGLEFENDLLKCQHKRQASWQLAVKDVQVNTPANP
jgi:hypothetical protein